MSDDNARKLVTWLRDTWPGAGIAISAIAKSDIPVPGRPYAGPKRRAQFHGGRRAATTALAEIGFVGQELPTDCDGVPLWPIGALGSISHTDRIAGAIAVPKGTLIGIGLDIEPSMRLSAEETSLIRRLDEQTGIPPIATFVAKEASYKAIFPVTRYFLDFQDITIRFATDGEGFRATLSMPNCPVIQGRYKLCGNLVVALAWA